MHLFAYVNVIVCVESKGSGAVTMDIYSKNSFRKNLYNILKKAIKTNEPVEILTGDEKENGSNESMVLLPKDEYLALKKAQNEQIERSTSNIATIAEKSAVKIKNKKQLESWLEE